MADEESDFQKRMQRIEVLVREIESFGGDGQMQATASELVSLLMELHGNGLRRMVEMLEQGGPTGTAAIERFAADPLIGSLLILYGVHPDDLETRVNRGLAAARPYLESHGGNVELLRIDEGRVTLRLVGNCHGCPSSAVTMNQAVEEAICEFAPDVVAVEVEQPADQAPPAVGFVSLDNLR